MKKKLKTQTVPAEPENQEVEVKKGRKVVNLIVNIVLIIALVVAAVCTYVSFVSASGNGVPSVLGMEFFSIQTAQINVIQIASKTFIAWSTVKTFRRKITLQIFSHFPCC